MGDIDAKIFTIFEETSEIQRMLIGRAVTGSDVRQPDLRTYLSCTRETGRSTAEWGGLLSSSNRSVRAGCFPSFPSRVLNPCRYLRACGLDQACTFHVPDVDLAPILR
jgi:hypothetical protein